MSKSAGDRQEFSSSLAKDELRHDLDRRLIEGLRDRHYPEIPLTYFGLPGEDLLDILAWREFLGDCTLVEDHDENAERLELTVLRNHLEGQVRFIRTPIDQLIPAGEPGDSLAWPYQIVNLDYVGGLINARDDRTSRRLDAIKQLFPRQARTAFVLLLTLNLRDDDKGEMDELVAGQEDDLASLGLTGVKDTFDAHRAEGHAGLLKLYVPIILESAVHTHSLAFTPPVLYRGTKTMMHFAITCAPYEDSSAGRVSKTVDRIDLINLPLLAMDTAKAMKEIRLGEITGQLE